jgi:creatinine amidohydrolase
MNNSVLYEELLPHEFASRLKDHPIGHLPLGTLEWHESHNALKADSLQAKGLFEFAARKFGGIVFPPIFLGPDSIALDENTQLLTGMDKAKETQPTNNCQAAVTGY